MPRALPTRWTSAGRSEVRGAARFYDGETARAHPVTLRLAEDRQALILEGATLPAPLRWRLADLRAIDTERARPDRLTLTRHLPTEDEAPRDPARLVIEDAVLIEALRRSRPALGRRDLHRGAFRRIATYAAAALGAVVLMLFVILPAMADTLARIIPLEREIAFGRSVMAQMERFLGGDDIGALHCDAPEGLAALDRLEARLLAGQDLPYEIEITVFDHPMLNAFAAPGGQVVLMRGLIDAAQGPDEVAGVLAHEIGHVVARDATRQALRATGSAGLLSLVLGDFSGGFVVVALGDQVINSGYTRSAEGEADGFALAMLDGAEVSAQGLADFFAALDAETGGGIDLGYLATHPVTASRAERAEDHAAGQAGTTPAMTEADWQALKTICDT